MHVRIFKSNGEMNYLLMVSDFSETICLKSPTLNPFISVIGFT